jgi:MFS family permease
VSAGPEREVNIRALGATVYLPSLIFGIGQGAVLPVIVVSATQLGASLAMAGLVVALIGIGAIVADVPAGTLTDRVGERAAMGVATVAAMGGTLLCIVAPTVLVLSIGVFLIGGSTAVWSVARQVYVTDVIPFHLRARALSALGGMNRIGLLVGPFIGAVVTGVVGVDGAYVVFLVCAFIAGLLLWILPDIPSANPGLAHAPHGGTTWSIIKSQATILRTLGTGIFLVGTARAARQSIIPLWGAFIGLDAATISLIFGVSGILDTVMFYPAGKVMDLYGRRWVAIPSMLILGISFVLIPFTSDATQLALVALLVGFGNGISNGIVMTLGADVAPPNARAQFLGAWRLCHDLGKGFGPLTTSIVISLVSLAAASVTMGLAAFGAAALLARWVPRMHSAHPAPALNDAGVE